MIDPSARWETVGPTEARLLLRLAPEDDPATIKIVGQRPAKPSVWRRYQADITADRWKQTHQAIGIDLHNDVIDGQHRLLAVIASGKPIRLLVVRGLDPAARMVIDTGSARTAFDTMTLMGFGYSRRVIQIAAYVMTRRYGRRPSHPEVVDCLELHGKALSWADGALAPGRGGVASVPIGVVLTRAFYTGPQSRLASFAEILRAGTVSVDDAPAGGVVLLRNWLLPPTGQRSKKPTAQAIYRKTERACEAYLKGHVLTKLYEAGDELFPFPEEKHVDESSQEDLDRPEDHPSPGN